MSSQRCCDYRDHSPGPCTCPEHERSDLHPHGKPRRLIGAEPQALLGVADFDYDHQAEQGQGPPA